METISGRKHNYILEGRLGEKGKFGGIHIALVEGSGQKVTIKILEKYSWQLVNVLDRLQHIENKHIAKIFEFFVSDEKLYIVRECVDGIDLKFLLDNRKYWRKIKWKRFVEASISLLSALEVVHGLGIVHRDIKPSNIIIRSGQGDDYDKLDFSDIVLIDFEQACLCPNVSEEKSPFAMLYSPPEMILGYNNLVCPASDIFSVGIMLFQLISGENPYPESNPEFIMNLQLTYPLKKSLWMKDSVFEVISKATHKQAFRRPPSRLEHSEIEDTLLLGISERYESASEMKKCLENIL
ncbi:MAG: serine/threonine protein kinase [Bacteroidales bacterium]|nr:serine/threonine protein kinase [Bacteroidales bacterium]